MGYNIFSRLFKKPKEEQEEHEEQQETVNAIFSISIVADDEGYLNIDCSFDTSADNVHEVIADTFFCMDDGKISATALQLIVTKLSEMDIEIDKEEFLSKVILEYARFSSESKAKKQHPIVSPIDVFKLE
tara:strand:- start:2 stop:391 length:390 start_codon:yes stop_codon:yes gene_type:complete